MAESRSGYGARVRVISFDPSGDVYALWDHVRVHHWYLLAAPTLECLQTFWMSYTAALRHRGLSLAMGEPDVQHFSWWVAAKRGEPQHTGGWPHFLAREHEGHAGFDAFFAELAEFRTRRLSEIGAATVPGVLWPARRFTVTPDGTEVEEPIVPIVRVRLLAYTPEDAVWAEIPRADGSIGFEWLGSTDSAVRWCRNQLQAEVVVP